MTDAAGDDDGPAWTVARLLSQWIEAGQPIAAFWRATPRIVLIAVHAYFDRRAWSAWATGQTARGAIADMGDLLPKPSESDDARDSRIERAAAQWNLRFEAMATEDAGAAAGSEE